MKTKILLLLGVALLMSAITQPAAAQNHYTVTSSMGAAFVSGTDDIGLNTDDATTTITLPFVYSFYGSSYGEAIVSSNGNIQFTGNTNSNNPSQVPISGFSDSILAYNSDLYTGSAIDGQGVYTSISGISPNRVFNIEWRAVFCCGPGLPSENFEVRLYEGIQKFEIIYNTVTLTSDVGVGVQQDMAEYTAFDTMNPGSLQESMRLTFSAFAPTAAGVSVTGKVVDEEGMGLRNAIVSIAGSNGIIGTSTTATFGNFHFDDVPAGQTYILSVRAKGLTIPSQAITLRDDMSGIVLSPRVYSRMPRR